MADGTTPHPVDATSIENAHPSSLVADRITADPSTMDISAQLPNFPIPHEFRDKIYGYLLHSDYTRIARERKTAPDGGEGLFKRQGYRFHTNILGVNKAIHEESEEYLYKNNVFVVASAEWHFHGLPDESLLSGKHWTPIITEIHAVRMRHHSLRLHITKGRTVERCSLGCCGSRTPAIIRSCVIIANDLGALCATLRWHALQHPGFAIMLEDDPGPGAIQILGLDESTEEPKKPNRFKIQFRDTPFRARDANMQSKTFDVLRKIACADMRVTFDGLLPEYAGLDERIKQEMGPTLITRHGYHWSSFETMCEVKQLGDDAICVGELHLAADIYQDILNDAARYIHSMATAPLANPLSLTLPVAQAILVLMLDVVFTLFYLQLAMGKLPELQSTMEYLLEITDNINPLVFDPNASTPDAPESFAAVSAHLSALGNVYVVPSKTLVGEVVDILGSTEYKQFPHHSHDLAILSKVPNQKDVALEHLPLHVCSASVLEPRRFLPSNPGCPYEAVGHHWHPGLRYFPYTRSSVWEGGQRRATKIRSSNLIMGLLFENRPRATALSELRSHGSGLGRSSSGKSLHTLLYPMRQA